MRSWILFLFVASTMSGCLTEGSNDAETLDAKEPAIPSASESEPSPSSPTSSAASPTIAPTRPEAETRVAIQESLGYFVCAPLVHQPGWCMGFGLDVGGYWEGSLKGNASTFTFTVEWMPATPASTELEVGLVCVEGPKCPDEAQILATAMGTSPLTLDVQGDWAKGSKMVVYVATPNFTEPLGHYSQVRDGTTVDGKGAFTP